MKLLLCLFAACSMVLATTRDEYCATCPGQHTMCIYNGISNACDPQGAHGVSNEEKNMIVDLHNKLRNKTWDDGLAEVAQRWADQCNYGHDACRRDPRFKDVINQVGQNVAYDASCEKKADWNVPMNMWYNEVSKFDRNDVNNYRFLMPIGHYSQVVWAETNKVGCGFRTYTTGGSCRRYYVCNYGPTGNFSNSKVYLTGSPSSA
ncbi:venom allergen 5 [Anabrus simplex]|uniref:venom allergen 5 n=1 Tax=Anabrus simplex TaxID=316456 RepID=UPI0035A2BF1D